MTTLLVVTGVVVALLIPAQFALDYGSRAIHARSHAACLRRIEALERDLGMRESEARFFDALRQHYKSEAIAARSDPGFAKTWEKNRKRLAKIQPSPYRRRARD